MVVFTKWRRLPVDPAELWIQTTLRCGQSFRAGYADGQLCQSKTNGQGDGHGGVDDTEALLRQYFALDVRLTDLYSQWAADDANFKRKAPRFAGIRILQQEAWEALVSFICSSNNNISRISQMVDRLCVQYGDLIGRVDGQAYHDFPTPERLAGDGVEMKLRELGFGYRAKYLHQTARAVVGRSGLAWLAGLSNPDRASSQLASNGETALESGRAGYRTAHESLLQLQGVGPKVADCVCLMGLGWSEAVPIDTHVWQIAQRDYGLAKSKKSKTVTPAMYAEIGGFLRKLWGPYAGWAQSVLFTANLKSFQSRVSLGAEVEQVHSEQAVQQTGIVKDELDRKMVMTTLKSEEAEAQAETVPPVTQIEATENFTKRHRTRSVTRTRSSRKTRRL
ncbi:8-oxoguanine glycosylase ogg1 [Ascosphaera acerosa]|nr:8-oxoguanine glycosylase ogg1 [Ascosphaera acerosa]